MYTLLLAKLFLIGFTYVMGMVRNDLIVNVANNVIVMNI